MNKVLKYKALLLASAVLFSACGEKDNNDVSDTPSGGGGGSAFAERKLSKIDVSYVGHEEIVETIHFVWENDKLVALGGYLPDGSWHEACRFSYDGDLPTGFSNPGIPAYTASYTHNDGRISHVRFTETYSEGTSEDKEYSFSYTYTDGNITSYTIDRPGTDDDTMYLTWTGNNIATMRLADGDELQLQYSSKKNPIRLPQGVGLEFNKATNYRGVFEYLSTVVGFFSFWTENLLDADFLSLVAKEEFQYTFDGDWPVEMVGPDVKGTPTRIKFYYAD